MILQNSLPHHPLQCHDTPEEKFIFLAISKTLLWRKGSIVAVATTFEQTLFITLAACRSHAPWTYDVTIAILSFSFFCVSFAVRAILVYTLLFNQ